MKLAEKLKSCKIELGLDGGACGVGSGGGGWCGLFGGGKSTH